MVETAKNDKKAAAEVAGEAVLMTNQL